MEFGDWDDGVGRGKVERGEMHEGAKEWRYIRE